MARLLAFGDDNGKAELDALDAIDLKALYSSPATGASTVTATRKVAGPSHPARAPAAAAPSSADGLCALGLRAGPRCCAERATD